MRAEAHCKKKIDAEYIDLANVIMQFHYDGIYYRTIKKIVRGGWSPLIMPLKQQVALLTRNIHRKLCFQLQELLAIQSKSHQYIKWWLLLSGALSAPVVFSFPFMISQQTKTNIVCIRFWRVFAKIVVLFTVVNDVTTCVCRWSVTITWRVVVGCG